MNKKRALINKAEKQQQESKETKNRNHWGQRRKVVTKCKAKQSSNQRINKKSKNGRHKETLEGCRSRMLGGNAGKADREGKNS